MEPMQTEWCKVRQWGSLSTFYPACFSRKTLIERMTVVVMSH
jgi:hypothetical protein